MHVRTLPRPSVTARFGLRPRVLQIEFRNWRPDVRDAWCSSGDTRTKLRRRKFVNLLIRLTSAENLKTGEGLPPP